MQKTFKASIGRLGAGGRRKIAVAVSGGESSCSAAILLRDYHSTLVPNPNLETAQIVLIHVLRNVSNVLNCGVESCGESQDKSLDRVPVAIRTLHNAIPNSQMFVATLDQEGAEPFHNFHDVDDVTDLVRNAIRITVTRMATSVGCDTVIFGTSVSRTACDILQAIVSGRGTQVHKEARGIATLNDVNIVMPLNSVPLRLLVRFARMNFPEVDFIYQRVGSSLHAIVQRFVCAIGCDNPSSVHNVVRVAGRLKPNDGASCFMCGHAVAINEGEQHCDMQSEDTCKNDDICKCNGSVKLCFGCTRCFERSGAKMTYDTIQKLAMRESMRKEIAEFLL